MSRFLRLLAALLLATPVAAQRPIISDEEQAAIAASDTARDAGHYLAATRALEPAAFDPAGKPRPNIAWQYWTQFGVMLTDDLPSVSPYPPTTLTDAERAAFAGVTLTDALDEIAHRARDTRIVVLNEAHTSPRDRAFALEVARRLRPLGYATLAMETLDSHGGEAAVAARTARIARDGYLRRADGAYTQDPAFADFVRQALALGYRPVAYEDTGDVPGIAAREEGETRNLLRRAVPHGAENKLLIYVGHSHVTEAPLHEGGPLWMAGRLKAATGIDPLTIDQTWLGSNPAQGHSEQARLVLASQVGRRSAVLMKDGKPFVWGGYADAVDLQVIHPAIGRVAGRPGWLVGMGRRSSAIPAKLLPTTGIRLVQAFLANEAPDAVPIDQILVTAGQPAPSLMLPPGARVRYAVEDDTGTPPLHAARQ